MITQRMLRLSLPLCICLMAHPVTIAACPPADYSRSDLLSLKQAQFTVEDDASRNRLATELLVCTNDPDPAIRDGVVFEGLATWLRSGQLSAETVHLLRNSLLEQLEGPADPAGFRKPFAALILAEVARTDRIAPAFTPAEREQLVRAAATYLAEVRDYRGFSAIEGWRHGVAHGSDLCLQLVLNPNITPQQVQRMLASIAVQVAPSGEVFYIYGEPERLARAAFYALRRGDLAPREVQVWMQGLVDPHPLTAWSDAYTSQAGLARRHNTLAFLQALLLYAVAAGDEQGTELAGQLLELVAQVKG